jgi:hypothetical protein
MSAGSGSRDGLPSRSGIPPAVRRAELDLRHCKTFRADEQFDFGA